LRNVVKIPLPGLSTIRRWASKIKINVDVLTSILHCMEFKGRGMRKFEKLVVLTFDKIYLNNKISIDRETQQVVRPHKTCQCVMVRSLFSNWKQPIHYYYDKAMTKDTIFNIIACLYDVDYTVAITSDMGPGNMALWAELEIGIAPKNSFFQHPCNVDLKVYVFADAPHLLKLLRNHFLDEGFNIDDRLIDKKCIQKVLAINVKDLKVAFAISQYYLDVKESERKTESPPCCPIIVKQDSLCD